MSQKKKVKNFKKFVFILLAIAVLAVIFVGTLVYNALTAYQLCVGARKAGELRIHFLSVGQGDCTLIEFPDGKKMLIDGGNGAGENDKKIVAYLRALRVKTLDYMLLTHSDADHCGGLERVVENFKVSRAFLPHKATLTSTETYRSLYEAVLRKVSAVEYSERYDYIAGENYFLMLLSPKSLTVTEDADDNETSAVAWLDYQGVSALFAGDMTAETEEDILRDCTLEPYVFTVNGKRADLNSTEILKVAHHGSAGSSTLKWLQFLNFKTAIISCGVNNSYGHPAKDTLDRLYVANPQARVYRTDDCGDIVVTVTQDGKYFENYQYETQLLSSFSKVDGLLAAAYITKIKLSHTEILI